MFVDVLAALALILGSGLLALSLLCIADWVLEWLLGGWHD